MAAPFFLRAAKDRRRRTRLKFAVAERSSQDRSLSDPEAVSTGVIMGASLSPMSTATSMRPTCPAWSPLSPALVIWPAALTAHLMSLRSPPAVETAETAP